MGVIYLVRHGQAHTDAYGAVADPAVGGHLTDLGREQAEVTGRALAARIPAVDAVFRGEPVRHRETLEQILTSLPAGATPVVDPNWNEYDLDAVLGGGGLATTLRGRELQRRVDAALDAWVAPPAGHRVDTESFPAFARRCAAALDTAVAAAGSGRTVLVVASAGTISQAVCRIWGVPAPEWVRLSRTALNLGISKLMVGAGGTSVLSFNEHGHLEPGLTTFR